MIANEVVETLSGEIDEAYGRAEAGEIDRAVELFDGVRQFATRFGLNKPVEDAEQAFREGVQRERESFAAYVNRGNPTQPDRRILVFADSLGLPRPGEAPNVVNARPSNYPFALREAFKRVRKIDGSAPRVGIYPWCQRYATSDDVVAALRDTDVNRADVVVHVGLNDFSVRIFTEPQRLSLSLLPNELVRKITRFAQADMYRFEITKRFPDHVYVPLQRFAENIETIASVLRAGNVRSITCLTIISLPMHVERHTANYRWNVTRYNNVLYDARRRGRINLIDIDRHAWEYGFSKFMHADLMHLSPDGHVYICNRFVERILGLKEYRALESDPNAEQMME